MTHDQSKALRSDLVPCHSGWTPLLHHLASIAARRPRERPSLHLQALAGELVQPPRPVAAARCAATAKPRPPRCTAERGACETLGNFRFARKLPFRSETSASETFPTASKSQHARRVRRKDAARTACACTQQGIVGAPPTDRSVPGGFPTVPFRQASALWRHGCATDGPEGGTASPTRARCAHRRIHPSCAGAQQQQHARGHPSQAPQSSDLAASFFIAVS
jgi:hypothetical protein